jgi:RNA polymerase sigma factor (sigma-70 family)
VRRIVVTCLADERRRGFARRERPSERTPDRFVADHAAGTTDRLAAEQALASLPPRQRAAIVLRYWEDQSIEQTARLLGCSTGTVKSQCARGLATLRAQLTATA